MKTKPTKAKRNQRKQNEIENGRKNNRGLKEIKPIFTITMLDYFPHMSAFHQERTWFVTIEQEYYAFIQRESVLLTWWLLLNLGTIRATSSLLKKCDDRTDKRTERQQKSYIPQSFFGGGIKILSKINFKN